MHMHAMACAHATWEDTQAASKVAPLGKAAVELTGGGGVESCNFLQISKRTTKVVHLQYK